MCEDAATQPEPRKTFATNDPEADAAAEAALDALHATEAERKVAAIFGRMSADDARELARFLYAGLNHDHP